MVNDLLIHFTNLLRIFRGLKYSAAPIIRHLWDQRGAIKSDLPLYQDMVPINRQFLYEIPIIRLFLPDKQFLCLFFRQMCHYLPNNQCHLAPPTSSGFRYSRVGIRRYRLSGSFCRIIGMYPHYPASMPDTSGMEKCRSFRLAVISGAG